MPYECSFENIIRRHYFLINFLQISFLFREVRITIHVIRLNNRSRMHMSVEMWTTCTVTGYKYFRWICRIGAEATCHKTSRNIVDIEGCPAKLLISEPKGFIEACSFNLFLFYDINTTAFDISGRTVANATNFWAARLIFQGKSRTPRLTFWLAVEYLWYFNANISLFFLPRAFGARLSVHVQLQYILIWNCLFEWRW